jgi:hypothetical protein
MAPKLAAVLGLVTAAALVIPATAATPKSGSFSGSTKQNRAISFKVTPGGKVKNVEFGFRGRCDNGATTSGTTKFGGKFDVNNKGKFRATGGSNSFVKGKFKKPRKAKGTLKWRGSTFDPFTLRTVSCSSPKVRWTASR